MVTHCDTIFFYVNMQEYVNVTIRVLHFQSHYAIISLVEVSHEGRT